MPTPVPQGRRLLAQESMQRIIVLLSIVAQCGAFSTIGRVSSGGSCIDEPDEVIAEEAAKLGAEYAQFKTCADISEAGGCERADAKAACCATCSLPKRMTYADSDCKTHALKYCCQGPGAGTCYPGSGSSETCYPGAWGTARGQLCKTSACDTSEMGNRRRREGGGGSGEYLYCDGGMAGGDDRGSAPSGSGAAARCCPCSNPNC